MESVYRTRGSSADREIYCAGAIGCETEYNDNGQDARTGTGAHALIGAHILSEPHDVNLMATQLGVPAKTLRIAYYQARSIWLRLEGFFPNPSVECSLSGLATKGTADLVSFDYSEGGQLEYLRILDWKLNEGWHPYQLRAYALAAVDSFGFPDCGYVDAIEAWMLPGTYHLTRLTEDDLEDFRTRLMAQHERAGKQFSAGRWCTYCPIRIKCTARDQYLQSAANALASTRGTPLTREKLESLWPMRTVLRKALDEFDRAVKLEIESKGPLILADGGTLGFHETQTPVFEYPSAVYQALQSMDIDQDALISISKTSLEKAIKAKAPKGQGAARVRETMAELKQAGLVTEKTTRRLRVTHD